MSDRPFVLLVEGCGRIRAATSPDAIRRALVDAATALLATDGVVALTDNAGRGLLPGPPVRTPVLVQSIEDGQGRIWGELRLDPAVAPVLDEDLGAALRQLCATAACALERCELRQAHAELHTVMQTVPAVIWLAHDSDASRITGSRFAADLLRLAPADNQSLTAPPGERPGHYRIMRNDEEVPTSELPLQRAARGEPVRNEELRVVFDDGSYFDELVSAAPILDAAGRPSGAVGTSVIITEQKQAEARAYRLAHQDPLTGLPNRLLFRRMLAKQREHVARKGGYLAVMLLDLDHFKTVNDTLGHLAGDEMLIEVARRLQQAVRRSDHVARLGGDEFAVLSSTTYRPEDFKLLAQRLVQTMAEPCRAGGTEIQPGVSIGITVFPDDASDPDGLLENADFALYAAKEDGRGRWRMFDPSLQQQARAYRELGHDLRRAIERREFELHYQPIVDIETLRAVEIEALLRWNDPVRGLLSPADFLPYLERSRLLSAVTDWVVEAGLEQSVRWGHRVPLAVNLPAVVLESDRAIERLTAMLSQAALPRGGLTVEIPESALTGAQAVASLEALRRLGVRVAIDDFGSGYSSIGRLCSLPIDQIKLGRGFLADASAGSRGRAILQAMVALAGALEVTVVVEGVERREQLALLRDVGCGRAQGFLFARPMPIDRIIEWLGGWAGSLAGTDGTMVAPLLARVGT
ncbi:MAG TPA: EAL domain-containing protein [Amaricoccus sp.]|uniref:putative bifunctional diguanylate cyclase/phosphodiesterase n=1 Tax=Amaricoccus sp. TaxID=1872485 RepID=UPI002C7E6126|nr:EAL domain-containing protein [Amaricoccus sp.]HMR31271.1 EAL domain-containing protein [Geminicoccus sp.]HMU00267.1 EAL domain-containing protein [Amaricoccus sp.]